MTMTLTVVAALGVAAALRASRSRAAGAPIHVDGQRLVIENHTGQAWQDVKVTVNAYYRATAASLDPGGRLEQPLASLETGFGHRFDGAREHVMRVEVRATTASGTSVALDWDGQGGAKEQRREP